MRMMRIRKITDGAYFVPSYSEQTITIRDELMTSQVIAVDEVKLDEDLAIEEASESEEDPFTTGDSA